MNGIYIPSIEAKDLIAAAESGKEYSLYSADGKINLKKFKKQFDYSLELIKLKEIEPDLSFIENDKEYSTKIISLEFNYNFSQYNLLSKNTYVLNGYSRDDIDFDILNRLGKYVVDNTIIAIQINRETIGDCGNAAILSNGLFYYDSDKKQYQIDKTKNKTLKTRAEIREILYNQGFTIDGVHYTRYKRSSGSARVGNVLFIADYLYPAIHNWEMCGLDIKEGDSVDLAALEAYISLTASNIIDRMEIKPNEILLVDDYCSMFTERVVNVQNNNEKLQAKENENIIGNSIFDGESLLDVSAFPQQYKGKGFLLLRNRFFKSACFNTNIQQFFRDNGITSIDQLCGITRAKSIEEIKLITTPSSIKYLKFGSFDTWLDNIDSAFGIVKYEKPPRYLHGTAVQCNYQIINSIHFTQEEMSAFVAPMKEYFVKLRKDPDVFRDYLGVTSSIIKDDTAEEDEREYLLSDFIYRMLTINANFVKTEYYEKYRNELLRNFKRRLKEGHIWVNGNYSVLLGNGLELLLWSIGQFNGESVLGQGCIFSKRFEFGKTILCARSPHITAGNVYLPQNKYNADIDKYFNLTPEIVYVNAIGENLQQRLNGCDYDSDSFLMTDNEILVNNALRDYGRFLTPVNNVEAVKTKRKYTNSDKADLDNKTACNLIGQIINTSQYLNSVLWHYVNNGLPVPDGLYNDICILAVLSNIEIDKAKKEFEISTENEMKAIQDRWYLKVDNKLIKPLFFRTITERNGYKISLNAVLRKFSTAMDYYTAEIEQFRIPRTTKQEIQERLDLSDFLPEAKTFYSTGGGGNTRKNAIERADTAIKIIDEYKQARDNLYIGYADKTKEQKAEIWRIDCQVKADTIEEVNRLINPTHKGKGTKTASLTLIYLIQKLEEKGNKQIAKDNIYFDILFSTGNKLIYSLFVPNITGVSKIVIDKYSGKIRKKVIDLDKIKQSKIKPN